MGVRMKKKALCLIVLLTIVLSLGKLINYYCITKNMAEKNLSIIWAQGEDLD